MLLFTADTGWLHWFIGAFEWHSSSPKVMWLVQDGAVFHWQQQSTFNHRKEQTQRVYLIFCSNRWTNKGFLLCTVHTEEQKMREKEGKRVSCSSRCGVCGVKLTWLGAGRPEVSRWRRGSRGLRVWSTAVEAKEEGWVLCSSHREQQHVCMYTCHLVDFIQNHISWQHLCQTLPITLSHLLGENLIKPFFYFHVLLSVLQHQRFMKTFKRQLYTANAQWSS